MELQHLQALYGLKWNPFSPEVPTEALRRTSRIESFCFRVESLVIDGGFAMITGDPGSGKSAMLRILAERLSGMRDLNVAVITRPQSGMVDFYREIGMIFGFSANISNRWGSYRSLREKWLAHIDSTLLRPVLLIDEAQEMPAPVLSEIRLLSSVAFDSKSILTVVLCGDKRLPDRFRTPELAPIGSRIRTRHQTEAASHEDMIGAMTDRLDAAGNKTLMNPEVIVTLVDHSMGNYRVLLQSADELLAHAVAKEAKVIDERLYFEVFQPPEPRTRKAPTGQRRS